MHANRLPQPPNQQRVRRRFWLLALLGPAFVLLVSACWSPSKPLQITNVTVSPKPKVGQIVTLEIELTADDDQPDVRVTVDTLESHGNKVHLVGGEANWQGALSAKQPQTFQVSVCVVEEGSWPVEITAVSYLPDNQGWDDAEKIQLESTLETGTLIRGHDYTFSQEEYARRPTPRPVTVSPECSGYQE